MSRTSIHLSRHTQATLASVHVAICLFTHLPNVLPARPEVAARLSVFHRARTPHTRDFPLIGAGGGQDVSEYRGNFPRPFRCRLQCVLREMEVPGSRRSMLPRHLAKDPSFSIIIDVVPIISILADTRAAGMGESLINSLVDFSRTSNTRVT